MTPKMKAAKASLESLRRIDFRDDQQEINKLFRAIQLALSEKK